VPAPWPIPVDAVTGTLLTALRCCGLEAWVVVATCAGEYDVRLCIRRDHPDAVIELLCDCGDTAPPRYWHAVRLGRDIQCVWRGPERGCPAGHVLRFVDDLLRLPDQALRQRYQPLG
jgi:hypothetical protein